MKLDEILLKQAVVSTAAENLDYLYDKTKDSGGKLHYILKRIIGNWFTEIYSKLGTGATSHKSLNKLSALISYAELYVIAKRKDDKETQKFAKTTYDRIIKEIKGRFSLKETTIGEILEKQKGFSFQLKKKGNKYYIYYAGKNSKAYPEGIENITELALIIRPWLKKSSNTFLKWGPNLQRKIVQKYIERLKKTLEE